MAKAILRSRRKFMYFLCTLKFSSLLEITLSTHAIRPFSFPVAEGGLFFVWLVAKADLAGRKKRLYNGRLIQKLRAESFLTYL